jgi:DNA-binding NarL/FixJ family response regulator
MNKIRLLLVDDHNVVRCGLRALLGSEADFEVVGEAASGREALMLTDTLKPDVVIMDLAMPLLNGLEATRQIIMNCPLAKVVVLSAYDDPTHVEQALAMEAAGYLLKHTAAEELIRAVREVHAGNAYFSAPIAEQLRARHTARRPKGPSRPAPRLSTREAEVLQLVAEGFPSKQIADELQVSVKTIEKHRQSLMDKLRLHCVADLVRHAAATGSIEMQPVKAILKPC